MNSARRPIYHTLYACAGTSNALMLGDVDVFFLIVLAFDVAIRLSLYLIVEDLFCPHESFGFSLPDDLFFSPLSLSLPASLHLFHPLFCVFQQI